MDPRGSGASEVTAAADDFFGDLLRLWASWQILLARGDTGSGGLNNPWVTSLSLVLDVGFRSGFDTGAIVP